nr:N-acetylglucosamine-6-O-sulfatase-like [Nerophis lumbriciformis]
MRTWSASPAAHLGSPARGSKGLLFKTSSRGSAVLALLPLGLLWACQGGPSERTFTRPPVILIDVDTLRADHLGCYGYERDTSPNIDRLAEQSVRFEWTFSQGPNTPPSQASILSALYPTAHGRIGNNQPLPPEVTTMAEVLSAAGYDTAAFVDGGLMAAGFGLEQGFGIYDDEAGHLKKIAPKVRDWLGQRASEQPFFLLVHTYDVHSPYELSPEPHRSRYLEGLELPSKHFQRNMSGVMKETWDARFEPDPPQLNPVEMDWVKALYDGGIRHVDSWVGELEAELRRLGLWDPSMVVFISDHGDELGEHQDLFHERLYSPVTRIPMMIKFPTAKGAPTPRRGVVSAVAESIDMMPTVLEALGLEVPDGIHGESLLPVIDGVSRGREVAISESPFRGRRIALATGDFRLLYTALGDSTELYDYRRDPHELNDVAVDFPEVEKRLKEGVLRWQDHIEQYRRESTEIENLKAETIEQLRALGYLD